MIKFKYIIWFRSLIPNCFSLVYYNCWKELRSPRITHKTSLPVRMSQDTNVTWPGLMESSQYLPLTALAPSLALISRQDVAGTSLMAPKETAKWQKAWGYYITKWTKIYQERKRTLRIIAKQTKKEIKQKSEKRAKSCRTWIQISCNAPHWTATSFDLINNK